MVKRLVFVIVISFGFITAGFSQFAVSYKNAKYNYGINLPKNMEIKQYPSDDSPDTVVVSNRDGSELIIAAGKDPTYKGVNASQLITGTFMPSLKFQYKHVELLENDYTDLGGEPAMYMKLSYKTDEEEGFLSQLIIIRNEKLIILRVKANKENYDKFFSELTGYIFTFQFTESSAKEFYRNDMYSFVINFPGGWPFDRNSFPVQANSPKGSSLYIEAIKSNEYADMSAYELDPDMLLEAMNAKMSNISLISKKKMNLDGNPVLYVKYRWVQSATGKGDVFNIMHFYLIKRGVLYVLQGMVRESQKDEENTIMQSVETFQFIK
ncbi:MAG: hypothetical protein LWX07_04740 [Bacteroidetes bacterium]|nr:hypothetical protein [Bacteroidota bacterium]